jgi:hypothetical protein
MLKDVEKRLRRLEEDAGLKHRMVKLIDGSTVDLDISEGPLVLRYAIDLQHQVSALGISQDEFDQEKLARIKVWAQVDDPRLVTIVATARDSLEATPLSEEELYELARSCLGPWIDESDPHFEEKLDYYIYGPDGKPDRESKPESFKCR